MALWSFVLAKGLHHAILQWVKSANLAKAMSLS